MRQRHKRRFRRGAGLIGAWPFRYVRTRTVNDARALRTITARAQRQRPPRERRPPQPPRPRALFPITSPPRQQAAHIRLQDLAGQNTRWRFVLISARLHVGTRKHSTSPQRQQGFSNTTHYESLTRIARFSSAQASIRDYCTRLRRSAEHQLLKRGPECVGPGPGERKRRFC